MEKVDPNKSATWLRFEKKMCDTCWASCCHNMPVEVSIPDLIRMDLLTEEEACTSLPKAARRLRDTGIIRRFRMKSLIFILEQKKNGDCIFLSKERRCTIYQTRPEICRQFPKIGPKLGFCPYKEKT